MLKRIAEYGLLVVLVVGIAWLWQSVPLPCEQPIEYSLGTFDDRFGLSQGDFLHEASLAEALWEGALGRELFRYVPGAPFTVNLIFDERQEQTLEGQKLESSFEKTKDLQGTLEEQQSAIRKRYEAAGREYEQSLTSFKKRLDAYNREVTKWNKAGGAPPETYEELEKVSRALSRDQDTLEAKRLEVNRLAGEVNAFSKKQVAVVEEYNSQVEEYAHRYGEPGEFDQGDYVGTEINIYQFDDIPHLRAVLTHEFGHALGLAHGSDPQSIMYHLMDAQPLDPVTLSTEDRTMLETQCTKTVWDVTWERLGLLRGRMTAVSGE